MNLQRREALKAGGRPRPLRPAGRRQPDHPGQARAGMEQVGLRRQDHRGDPQGPRRQARRPTRPTCRSPPPTSPRTAPWCRWVVVSALAGVEAIAILIEKNPNPLAASFMLPAGTDGRRPGSRWARPPTSMRWSSGRRPVPDDQEGNQGHLGGWAAEPAQSNSYQRRGNGRSDEDSRQREGRHHRSEDPDEPRDGDRPAQRTPPAP